MGCGILSDTIPWGMWYYCPIRYVWDLVRYLVFLYMAILFHGTLDVFPWDTGHMGRYPMRYGVCPLFSHGACDIVSMGYVISSHGIQVWDIIPIVSHGIPLTPHRAGVDVPSTGYQLQVKKE